MISLERPMPKGLRHEGTTRPALASKPGMVLQRYTRAECMKGPNQESHRAQVPREK